MFNASIPATGEAFFDRREEIRRLGDAVKSLERGRPKWFCLLGGRKIGKTSLLWELARQRAAPGLAFVFMDMFEDAPLTPALFRRYALRALDVTLGRDVGVSLEVLGDRPAEFRTALAESARFDALPRTLRSAILELPDLSTGSAGLRFALDVPEKLCEALGLRIVSTWDEFQEIAETGAHRSGIDLVPLVRSVWQKHKHVSYVISGSARSMLEELVTNRHSPFFQHFAVLELGPLSREDTIRLLTEGSGGGRPIPAAIAEEVHATIGGHPFYLQLMGEALSAQRESAEGPSVKEAIGELLFSRTGRLALYFQNEFRRLVGRASTLAATLEALAAGPRRLTDVARSIGAQSGATAGYIHRLEDVVERGEDGRYRLADPVFGLWLRWRSPGGTVVPATLLGSEAEKRAAEVLARMGFDLVYQSRASRGAFDLLAARGPCLVGIQVKRSGLPVRIPLTAWKRMEADGARLGWRWAIAVLTPPPEEAILLLDPTRARRRKTVSLSRAAVIENFLAWVDRA
jgi:AAA+ ATPase superfamily predicted ATPase